MFSYLFFFDNVTFFHVYVIGIYILKILINFNRFLIESNSIWNVADACEERCTGCLQLQMLYQTVYHVLHNAVKPIIISHHWDLMLNIYGYFEFD